MIDHVEERILSIAPPYARGGRLVDDEWRVVSCDLPHYPSSELGLRHTVIHRWRLALEVFRFGFVMILPVAQIVRAGEGIGRSVLVDLHDESMCFWLGGEGARW